MRANFQNELKLLERDLVQMGNLVESSIRLSIDSLFNCNIEMAQAVILADQEVNNMERVIERRCLNLLLKEQPLASDLRFVSSSLKIITDMERIGDQARDISQIAISICKDPSYEHPLVLEEMSKRAIDMVRLSIDSFVKRDLDLVKDLIELDHYLDQDFLRLRQKLIRDLREESGQEEEILDYLMIAKYLERIGDHAENISKWVYFSIEGRHYSS